MNISIFLSIINSRLRKDKPLIPFDLNQMVSGNNNFLELWFKSKGCRFSFHGSCTYCDYWHSIDHNHSEINSFIEEGFNSIISEPNYLLILTSGSVLDLWQVPWESQMLIFDKMSKYSNTKFILETHLETISEKIVSQIRQKVIDNDIFFEIGVESFNTWTLKYSLNKNIDISMICEKLKILKKYRINSIANVLVGAPFLSLADIIKDSVDSVNYALSSGFDSCVLFPINIKKWTLIDWLFTNNKYKPPSLWTFIEVLNNINDEFLNVIEIAWFENRKQFNPAYSNTDISPTTCNICYSKVVELLKIFKSYYALRKQILNELNSIKCSCKTNFYHELNNSQNQLINLCEEYQFIASGILGSEWWNKNQYFILSDIKQYSQNNIIK